MSKLRLLLIVNPKATTVSSRLKNLVVYALRGRYDVEAIETEGRGHATALTRETAGGSYDAVVAFGGDGTVNEAANGLAGSSVPLSVLPGGCTNVVCRLLGIPTDVVDATEHLLGLADGLRLRRIDLGRVNGRYFVSSSGVGLDAETTRWVDERTWLKSRAGPLFFTGAALTSFFSKYGGKQPRMVVDAAGQPVEAVTAVVQNAEMYTYFNSWPLRLCEEVDLESGSLSMMVLRKAARREAPALAWRLLAQKPSISSHPGIESLTALREARVAALEQGGEPIPFPVQVDGDYIGDETEVRFEIVPASLSVVV